MRGVTQSGSPVSCRFSDGEEWVRAFKNLKLLPETTLVKLTAPTENKEQKHFIYILWWLGKGAWMVEGTNYSGTGGHTYAVMEEWLKQYKQHLADKHPEHFHLVEAEIPYNAWWTILNALYHIFTAEQNETHNY